MQYYILACGPMLNVGGMFTAVAILLAVKPFAYYAFIQAFRFRVSRPIPMTVAQAGKLAAVRTVAGFALFGIGAVALETVKSTLLADLSWLYLYVGRVAIWWWMGSSMVHLRGRRLVGWVFYGTLLNAALDAAILFGLILSVLRASAFLAAVGVMIILLHYTGRRDALRMRFDSAPHCRNCTYNLTGNLSGICPECGTPTLLGPQEAAETLDPH